MSNEYNYTVQVAICMHIRTYESAYKGSNTYSLLCQSALAKIVTSIQLNLVLVIYICLHTN